MLNNNTCAEEKRHYFAPLTLLAFPRAPPFLLFNPLGPAPVSMAAAPPVICDPGPPRRFLFSLVADGGAKLPTGGILISGLGVCT